MLLCKFCSTRVLGDIGKPAPDWPNRWDGWAPPLRARALRGKVVLVRWWSDACPMCSGALPSLAGLYTQHRRDGLVIHGT